MSVMVLRICVWSFLAVVLVACDGEAPVGGRRAVVEATFDSDGFPTVLFSESVVPGIDGNLSDAVINWGKVTVSDGDREVVLTGRVDHNYVPPFRYYTTEMIGEPGKIYTLKVQFNGLHGESTVRMPYPTVIDSLTFASTEVDTLRAVTLHFTSPSDVPAYYYVTLCTSRRGDVPSPCIMGNLKVDRPLTPYSIAIMKPRVKIWSSEDDVSCSGTDEEQIPYTPHLTVGEEYVVGLNRVERSVWDFWRAYDNMVMFSSSPFISTSESLPSNIIGGYGVWSPQGSYKKIFTVD